MFYEFLCLMYVILNIVVKIAYKKVDIDVYTLNVISAVIIFLTFFSKDYITNIKDNKEEDNKKLINNLTSKESIISGITGCFYFITNVLALKQLPLSVFIPLSNTWIFFSLIFEKYMMNVDIKPINILIFGILFIGIITITYKGDSKGSKINKNTIFYIGLLILSSIIRAYNITYVKQQSHKFREDEMLIMNYFISIIVGIIALGIYIFTQKKYNIPNLNSILIIVGTVLILDNAKNYFKFESLENLSEDTYIIIYNTSVIFSLIFGYFIFDEKITSRKIIGTVIILSSILMFSYINKKDDKGNDDKINKENSKKKKINFL